MKKLVFAAALAAALVAKADLKLGVVDMMLLVKNHSAYEPNKQLLTSTEKDYQKRLDAMKAELESVQEEGRKLAEEYRNPMLAQAAKEKLEKDIMAVQSRFMQQQQKLRSEAMRNQQDLTDLEARLLKAQAEDLKKRISEYAKKKGYDCIVDSSAAIYSTDALDVTDAILESMGVDPKKARKADEGK
ncbi:MAG: OmpH family outer membrane protein [Kiritimatiellae bacterium]|nr:OmpH family outer membrane protein [Kiritimatiellia bacterium]